MPVKPHIKTYTNSSVDTLNAIRNSASTSYKDYVPVATSNAEVIRQIGKTLMDMPQLQNEFITSLVNRIAKTIIVSKLYQNPLAMFKKGMLDYGETIEEIFVNIASVFDYDPEVAETEIYKREIPDVRTAFHTLNYKKFYKVTAQDIDLRQAFLNGDSLTNFIMKITESLYAGANYDEFQVTKYLLCRRLLQGEVAVEMVNDTSTKDGVLNSVETIKAVSNKLTFPSKNYNRSKVINFTPKDEQYLLIRSDYEAKVGVEVLATAFHMDKAQFMGHEVLIDSFADLDTDRLNEIFANDKTYQPITADEKALLEKVVAVVVDKDYFLIYDNLIEYTAKPNEQGLYYNYWLHCWKTFSVSPFANAVAFNEGSNGGVSNMSVYPAQRNISITNQSGGELQLTVGFGTKGIGSHEVSWTFGGTSGGNVDMSKVKITSYGLVSLEAGATTTTTATINVICTLISNSAVTKTIPIKITNTSVT